MRIDSNTVFFSIADIGKKETTASVAATPLLLSLATPASQPAEESLENYNTSFRVLHAEIFSAIS